MSEHTYHLQKYAGTSTRHTCPQCGHKGEFTYYVDERNVPIDESCGRCNRERCGYHLTPSEYFKAHPADKRNEFTTWKQPEPPKAIPVSYLPSSLLATDTHRDRNNLFRFMSKEFGDVEANRVFDLYNVGTSRHWRNNDGLSTTFPQINEKGKLCQLKVMAYNPNTGKRMKNKTGRRCGAIRRKSIFQILDRWIRFGLPGKRFSKTMRLIFSKHSSVAI